MCISLQAGMRLLEIDGRDLSGATHQQAVDIIRRSYANKRVPVMKIVALPVNFSFENLHL